MRRLFSLAGALALMLSLSGCDVVEHHTVLVDWSIDGQLDTRACTTYGISHFVVDLDGPGNYTSNEIPCTRGVWSVSVRDPLDGTHTIVVTAYDAAGARLGTASGFIVVDTLGPSPQTATVQFTAGDFQARAKQDVKVSWTVKGSSATAACGTYGIAKFVVNLDGPDKGDSTGTACTTEAWTTLFPDFTPGSYTITVTAYDAANTVVGSVGKTVAVDAAATPTAVNFDFQDADLGVVNNAKISIFWNINGTVDGTAKGVSWDSCAEVGAKSVVVTVDGNATTFDCHAAGDMSATIDGLEDKKAYALTVKLVDAAGKDLTTEVKDSIQATVAGGELIGDFLFDSFFEPKKTGTEGQFHFLTTMEQKSCDTTSPPVEFQMTIIRTSDNVALDTVSVCDLGDTNCAKADGTANQTCSDIEQVLSMLPWGSYKLEIQGATKGLSTCWESKRSILIGAGKDNPVVGIDLARLSGVTCI